MSPSLLTVMNEHPALGVVLCCTTALLGAFFYLSVRRFCTMVERVNRWCDLGEPHGLSMVGIGVGRIAGLWAYDLLKD